jgi:hypothetical protein
MNTKQYQKIDVTVAANETVSVRQMLKSNYTHATGLFFYPKDGYYLDSVTCSLRIDGNEILPNGTDVALFSWGAGLSRNDTLWKFYSENVESANKYLEATFENTGSESAEFSIYVLLENNPGQND